MKGVNVNIHMINNSFTTSITTISVIIPTMVSCTTINMIRVWGFGLRAFTVPGLGVLVLGVRAINGLGFFESRGSELLGSGC